MIEEFQAICNQRAHLRPIGEPADREEIDELREIARPELREMARSRKRGSPEGFCLVLLVLLLGDRLCSSYGVSRLFFSVLAVAGAAWLPFAVRDFSRDRREAKQFWSRVMARKAEKKKGGEGDAH